MAQRNIVVCDRCGSEAKDRYGRRSVKRIEVDDKPIDLCSDCGDALGRWLSRDNTTRPGYPPPGMEELCTHVPPCGGSCGGPLVPIR